MGRFATGVAVMTAYVGGRRHGVTINSLCSLSLEPPLLGWSLALDAPSLEAFSLAEGCAAHVLSEGQEDMARRFASPVEAPATDKFAGLEAERCDGGAPRLIGCLARFFCTPEASHAAGDHRFFVIRAKEAEYWQGRPLVFYRGRYFKSSKALEGSKALEESKASADITNQHNKRERFPRAAGVGWARRGGGVTPKSTEARRHTTSKTAALRRVLHASISPQDS